MIYPMIILGIVCIFFGVLLLVAFWLGYKAGIKEMPEMPQSKINLDDVMSSEEQDFELEDSDYLKRASEYKEVLKENLSEEKEPEVLET